MAITKDTKKESKPTSIEVKYFRAVKREIEKRGVEYRNNYVEFVSKYKYDLVPPFNIPKKDAMRIASSAMSDYLQDLQFKKSFKNN